RLKSMRTIDESGIEPLIDGLIPKLFAPEHVETMPEQVRQAKQIGYATPPAGATIALEAMRTRPDRNSVLAEATCPILLIAGENDQIISPETTFSVRNDRIKQVLLDRVGHMSMMEHPQRLADELADFIQSV